MTKGYILNDTTIAYASDITTLIAAGDIIPIATATNVSGAALASTALTFVTGITLATHIPVFYVVKFNSGVLGIGVVKMKNGAADLTALAALLTLTSTQQVLINNLAAVTLPNSGNLSVEVITASLAASSFDIIAYGMTRP